MVALEDLLLFFNYKLVADYCCTFQTGISLSCISYQDISLSQSVHFGHHKEDNLLDSFSQHNHTSPLHISLMLIDHNSLGLSWFQGFQMVIFDTLHYSKNHSFLEDIFNSFLLILFFNINYKYY